jgi:hypothetical protein
MLTTTLTPTSGQVRIAGLDLLREQAALRRELGIVFQQPSLDLNLTAEENIRLHAVQYGLYPWRPAYRLMPAAYREQVRALAGLLGIAASLRRPARSLSGGMPRMYFSSTSPQPASIRKADGICGRTWGRRGAGTGPRSSSPRTTSRKRRPPTWSAC